MKCYRCNKEFLKADMVWTRDCQGIPFHHVCYDCYTVLMAKGYDGKAYSQADIDELIEEEW